MRRQTRVQFEQQVETLEEQLETARAHYDMLVSNLRNWRRVAEENRAMCRELGVKVNDLRREVFEYRVEHQRMKELRAEMDELRAESAELIARVKEKIWW